jgi:hypothetical protein
MPLALMDSTERKRTSPARCRMHRTIARWTNGNPLMFHKAHSDPVTTCGIRMSLHYTGLSGKAMLATDFGAGLTAYAPGSPAWTSGIRGVSFRCVFGSLGKIPALWKIRL